MAYVARDTVSVIFIILFHVYIAAPCSWGSDFSILWKRCVSLITTTLYSFLLTTILPTLLNITS